MMSSKLRKLVAGIGIGGLLMMASSRISAQSLISGPRCVTPGTIYQYVISGKSSSTAVMRICITGGKMTNGKACSPVGTIQSMVLVVWDSSANVRKITVTNTTRTDSLVATGTIAVIGGVIDDSDKVQAFNKRQAVYTFRCSKPIGGSCSPNYRYKWQSSENGINWKDIEGAIDKDLRYMGSITGSTFFRRITTESQSNSIGYSDWGRLDIDYGSSSN